MIKLTPGFYVFAPDKVMFPWSYCDSGATFFLNGSKLGMFWLFSFSFAYFWKR